MFSYYFSSVWVAEWPPFEKYLLTWLTICSLRNLTICNFISRFGFEGVIWVLFSPVPGHCILFTLSLFIRKSAFCICENKDADQLRGDREADQRLCFRYTDSTIPLLP